MTDPLAIYEGTTDGWDVLSRGPNGHFIKRSPGEFLIKSVGAFGTVGPERFLVVEFDSQQENFWHVLDKAMRAHAAKLDEMEREWPNG